MSSFACYWPWLLGGAALGSLFWQLFDRFFRRDGEAAGIRLTRDLDAAKSQASSLHADLNGANGRVSSLKMDLETAHGSLKAKTDEALHIRTELTDWMAKHSQLESHASSAGLAATAAAATAATAAAMSLKSAHDKHDALKGEFDNAFRALNTKTEEHARVSAELADWKTRHSASDTQAKSIATELADWKAKHTTIDSHARATAAELAEWRTKHATTESQVKASAGELAEWKARHATLDSQTKAHAVELDDWKSKHAAVDTHAKSTAAQLSSSTSSATAAALAAAAAIAALQARYDGLHAELEAAKGSLSARTADATRFSASLTAANDKYAALRPEHEQLMATLKSDHERAARSLHTDLDAARGSFRAKSEEATRLSAELDEWKRRYATLETQSKQSLQSANTVALAASLGFKPQKGGRDDLTIVEGIGPKINELLIAGGIDTFVKLANAPVERVQAILDAAGPSFRLAKPASWARQASLCASGEWQALRALQDALAAGVDTDGTRS